MKVLKTFLVIFFIKFSFAQYQCFWYSFNAASSNLQTTGFIAQTTVAQSAIGKLTSATHLGYIGFWYPSIISGIFEDKTLDNKTQLLTTKLYNAYPNPMTKQVTISYSLASPAKVILAIYDISGREVITLVNNTLPSGFYTLSWHKTTNDHRKISSGVYFYTLKTDNYKETKKLIITD
ncbi:MAG: T9SS type A sorting domain-containing protein [candidate division WOR-3 bacterium]|nr:T9SS type A sorting domain-containing protein [candidate division WOR-3 bacterium]MCX7757123.1 T9SS type A sorting domain-containing protein [candidate division WOR-3 bacterium]MDW7988000.1 T9SS type A sorting domain-containing protein [candidate division WOR-3 bacterium]